MKVEFDEYGYLKPYEPIALDLETFQEVFVANFPNSKTRVELSDNYIAFLDAFKSTVIAENFVQWINGSFVTKKLHPQDIDVVILIDNDIYENKQKVLYGFQNIEYYKKSKIDYYFLRLYQPDHAKYFRTESDLAYWKQQFTFAKKSNSFGKHPRKGFIQLNF